jgi:hypothetical protein
MSTTMVDSWAVDLANVGPVYPFVGTEVIWVILGVAFWIGWHVWQIKFETSTYDEDKKLLNGKEGVAKAMRDGRLE